MLTVFPPQSDVRTGSGDYQIDDIRKETDGDPQNKAIGVGPSLFIDYKCKLAY